MRSTSGKSFEKSYLERPDGEATLVAMAVQFVYHENDEKQRYPYIISVLFLWVQHHRAYVDCHSCSLRVRTPIL